jgi:Flp pilus assembly pilin Flp
LQDRIAQQLSSSITLRDAASWPGHPSALSCRREVNQLPKLFFDRFAREEEGQTMAEYGVVLAVITAGIILALGALSGAIGAALDAVTAML